jgi:hypothetical protein
VGLLWKTAAGEEIAVVESEEEGVAAIFGQGSSGRRQNQKKKKTGHWPAEEVPAGSALARRFVKNQHSKKR